MEIQGLYKVDEEKKKNCMQIINKSKDERGGKRMF
jgi:hypothetical protein